MRTLRPLTVAWLLFAATTAAALESPASNERLNPAGIDGTLILVGGDEVPEAFAERFVAMSGGAKANLVVLSTIREQAVSEEAEKPLAAWKPHTVASLTHLHTAERKAADDPKFVEPLRNATGVWLSG